MCAKFVNNYSTDFDEEKINQHRLATETSKPHGFEDDVQLSKALTSLLRHRALDAKVQVHAGGYIDLSAILRHLGNRCTEEDIRRIVAQDKKGRFHIRENSGTGRVQVRANQGHTFPIEDDGSLLVRISHEAGLSEITHGTTQSAWLTIKEEGLRRMSRNHIHFIQGRAQGDDAMLPGYRNTSNILVIVDIRKAILDGIEFFRSQNHVILSPGDENGCIPIEYFKQVIDASTNEILWPKGTSLRKVNPESPVTVLCKGAKMSDLKRIKKEGLSRRDKEYIRLTRPQPPGAWGESKPAILVYVDAQKAMCNNMEFFFLGEKNDLVVTKGDAKGMIPSKFLKKIVDTKTDTVLWPVSK